MGDDKVKIICDECGSPRWVDKKVVWRTRFCEKCSDERKKERDRQKSHKTYQAILATKTEEIYLLIYDPSGMEDWPKRPVFSKTEANLFPKGCQFRNLLTGESTVI